MSQGLPKAFVELRSMITSDLGQMRKIESKSPIYAVALLVLVATEALSRLEGRARADDVFARELLGRHRGVPEPIGRKLFDLIRNGLSHLYDTKTIVIRGIPVVIVLSWRKMPHLSVATADWLGDGQPRRGLCVNVETMVGDLHRYFNEFEQRLRADPELAARVQENGKKLRNWEVPDKVTTAFEDFLKGHPEAERPPSEEPPANAAPTSAMTRDKEMDIKGAFCDLATQYYVAARLAAKAFQLTVLGNLFHHAVELFLKAALVGTLSMDEMKKPPYSHDLATLWGRFLTKENDPALAPFDSTILGLHAFETIRYPDEILHRGFTSTLAWKTQHQEQAVVEVTDVQLPPMYSVCVEEIDALIIELLDRASINPKFLAGRILNSLAREGFAYQNAQATRWGISEPPQAAGAP